MKDRNGNTLAAGDRVSVTFEAAITFISGAGDACFEHTNGYVTAYPSRQVAKLPAPPLPDLAALAAAMEATAGGV